MLVSEGGGGGDAQEVVAAAEGGGDRGRSYDSCDVSREPCWLGGGGGGGGHEEGRVTVS